jgi:hypothetical protein
MSYNDALNDECEALNSIYGDDTIAVTSASEEKTGAVLRFPNGSLSFALDFAPDYPDSPPCVTGTHSTGTIARGAGEAAVKVLHEVIGRVYTPSAVVLFDLIEEATPAIQALAADHGEVQDSTKDAESRSDVHTKGVESVLTLDPAANLPAPQWTLSEPLTINKSIFVARACPVSSSEDITNAVSHLLSTNKKVAGATHNIKAWRFKEGASTSQDYDDDGESAAGGRMLHLMQLMDVWDV